MLWIFTGIGLVFICVGIIYLINGDDEVGLGLLGIGVVASLALGILLCCVIHSRHSIIYNNPRQIEVLEENNKKLLAELEPATEKYLNYESGTLTNLKVNSDTLIAHSVYPELKGNEFVMEQVKTIKSNNREIREKKLELASLESYRVWLFMGAIDK